MADEKLSEQQMSGQYPIEPLLTPEDHELLQNLRDCNPARNLKKPRLTIGERSADLVAATVGSWRFIIIQSVILAIWIILNLSAWMKHWDPYPFILLNLMLSFQAAYTGSIVMMSQNRSSEIDRQRAQQDLDCDLKSQLEIELVHDKLNRLREREFLEIKASLDRIEAFLAQKGS
jgi:uncharacterized membrane protein